MGFGWEILGDEGARDSRDGFIGKAILGNRGAGGKEIVAALASYLRVVGCFRIVSLRCLCFAKYCLLLLTHQPYKRFLSSCFKDRHL